MVPLYKRCVHMPDNSVHFYPYGKEKDCVLSIKRRNIMKILTNRIKQLPGINHHYGTIVKNVNLDETSFDTINPDGSLTHRKYDFVFGTDGAFSAVQRSYLQTIDFNFSVEFGEYGYIELDIPVDEQGKNRTHDEVFHFWPRKGVMMAGFPNPEQNHTIGLFMKTKGENSFESFGGDAEKFQSFMHKTFNDTKYLMPNMKEDFLSNPVARIIVIHCFPWNRGNFLLIGDSAHAMTPFYGQGLNSGLEECTVIDKMIEQYNGHFPTIAKKFQEVRKPGADAISELSLKLFDVMREADITEGYLLARTLTTYLTDTYDGMFKTQQELVYLTHTDFAKCASYGKIEEQVLKEVLLGIPDINELVANKRRDPRIEKILAKYVGVYDLPEDKKPNDLQMIIKQKIATDLNQSAKYSMRGIMGASGAPVRSFSNMIRPPTRSFGAQALRYLRFLK